MLFAYRKGTQRITNKVWLKLEAAERAAGVISSRQVGDLNSATPAESSVKAKESGGKESRQVGDFPPGAAGVIEKPHDADSSDPESFLAGLPESVRPRIARLLAGQMLDGWEGLAAGFFADAEALASLVAKAAAMIGDAEMKAELLYFSKTVARDMPKVRGWHQTLAKMAGESLE